MWFSFSQARLKYILLIGSLLTIGFFSWLFWDLPSLDTIGDNLIEPSVRITDRHGRVLYEIIDSQGGRHLPVPIEIIPSDLVNATIATEDQTFYDNPGIDFLGIMRAFWLNVRGRSTIAGGSTITQQVARNLLLSGDEQFEQSMRRKIRESYLAFRLTQVFTKDEILGFYLNEINYGALSYGVEAASHTYFNKSVSELDLAESALIAGIPQSPSSYNPLNYPEAAKYRQSIVLGLMLKQGNISENEFSLANNQPLLYNSKPYPIEAPHFVMYVESTLEDLTEFKERKPESAIIVRTTLDLDLQHLAENAIDVHLAKLEGTNSFGQFSAPFQSEKPHLGHNVNNAALVALEPTSGEILAMIGSPDYFDSEVSGAINMALSPRQPGSALKPFIYSSAFDPNRENPFTPATMILDVEQVFYTSQDKPYVPSNFDNIEHGPVSARIALASSLNIPAVVVLETIEISEFIKFCDMLGISTLRNPHSYDLSLALGGGEVSLLELTAAYSVLANGGAKSPINLILDITTSEGEKLFDYKTPAPVQVIDNRVAWLISDILNDNAARNLGFGPNSTLKLDRPAAVKTGTTTNFHDNWTVGYTPDLVVGVWVGNANHEPMRGVTGLSGAAPIWHQFIREALTGTQEQWFSHPPGMTLIEVCSLSGMLPTKDCLNKNSDWFIDGTEPMVIDNVFHKLIIDSNNGTIATHLTPPHQKAEILVLNLPPEAHPWARSQGLSLYNDFIFSESASAISGTEYILEIVSPRNGSVYTVSADYPPNGQRLPIEILYATVPERIKLLLNGKVLEVINQKPFLSWWTLEKGDHVLQAEAKFRDGSTILSPQVSFTVLEFE